MLRRQVAGHYWALLLRDSALAAELSGDKLVSASLSTKTLRVIELVLALKRAAIATVGEGQKLHPEIVKVLKEGTRLQAAAAAQAAAATAREEGRTANRRAIQDRLAALEAQRLALVEPEKLGADGKPDAAASLAALEAEDTAVRTKIDAAKAELRAPAGVPASEVVEAAAVAAGATYVQLRVVIRGVAAEIERLGAQEVVGDARAALRQLMRSDAVSVATALCGAWNAPHLRDTRAALNVERALQSGTLPLDELISVCEGGGSGEGGLPAPLHTVAAVLPVITSALLQHLPAGVIAAAFDASMMLEQSSAAMAVLMDATTPFVALLMSSSVAGPVGLSLVIKLPSTGERGAPAPPSLLHFALEGAPLPGHQLWIDRAAAAVSAEYGSSADGDSTGGNASCTVSHYGVPQPSQVDVGTASTLGAVGLTVSQSAAVVAYVIATAASKKLGSGEGAITALAAEDANWRALYAEHEAKALEESRNALDALRRTSSAIVLGRGGKASAAMSLATEAVAASRRLLGALSQLAEWSGQAGAASDAARGPDIPFSAEDLRSIVGDVERLNGLPLSAALSSAIPPTVPCALSVRDRALRLEAAGALPLARERLLEHVSARLSTVAARCYSRALEFRVFSHAVASHITRHALAVATSAPPETPALTAKGTRDLGALYSGSLLSMFSALSAQKASSGDGGGSVVLAPVGRVKEADLARWGEATLGAAESLLHMRRALITALHLDTPAFVAFRDLFLGQADKEQVATASAGISPKATLQLRKVQDAKDQVTGVATEARACVPPARHVIQDAGTLMLTLEGVARQINVLGVQPSPVWADVEAALRAANARLGALRTNLKAFQRQQAEANPLSKHTEMWRILLLRAGAARQAIDNVASGQVARSRKAGKPADLAALKAIVDDLGAEFAKGVPAVLQGVRAQHDTALADNSAACMWRDALALASKPQPLSAADGSRFVSAWYKIVCSHLLSPPLRSPVSLIASPGVGALGRARPAG